MTIGASDKVAETFEAVLGAIYVDSQHDIAAVKRVIGKLGLTDHKYLMSPEEYAEGEKRGTRRRHAHMSFTWENIAKESRARDPSSQPIAIDDRAHVGSLSPAHTDDNGKLGLQDEHSSSPAGIVEANSLLLRNRDLIQMGQLKKIAAGASVKRSKIARKALREVEKLHAKGLRPRPLNVYSMLAQRPQRGETTNFESSSVVITEVRARDAQDQKSQAPAVSPPEEVALDVKAHNDDFGIDSSAPKVNFTSRNSNLFEIGSADAGGVDELETRILQSHHEAWSSIPTRPSHEPLIIDRPEKGQPSKEYPPTKRLSIQRADDIQKTDQKGSSSSRGAPPEG